MNWLLLLVCLSGFLSGLILAFIAPEELKPGRKYFFWAKYCLLVLIIIFSAWLLKSKYLIVLPFFYAVIYFLWLRKIIFNDLLNYLLFIAVSFFISKDLIWFVLILLYGLVAGTVFKMELMEKNQRKCRKTGKI